MNRSPVKAAPVQVVPQEFGLVDSCGLLLLEQLGVIVHHCRRNIIRRNLKNQENWVC